MHPIANRLTILIVGLITGMGSAAGQQATADPILVAGAVTRGGLIDGARTERVTTLADSGPGSLREALSQRGPKVIVFDVGGVIHLVSDLRIGWPNVTIAGQTAPHPGILITGAKIRIVAADVVLQHISVHPMSKPLRDKTAEIDGIAIGECKRCAKQVSDVRLENISAGWANDEVLGLWGDKLKRITIRNSIIAEGLHDAGHPKGPHSMGLLIGERVQAVEVTGNLFASNNRRNPVLGSGASAYVANNYIYNPGESAMHVYADDPSQITRANVIANLVKLGPSSSRDVVPLDVPEDLLKGPTPARIFAMDNRCCNGGADDIAAGALAVDTGPPVVSDSWQLMPVAAVQDWVTRHAGSRPNDRSSIDARIISSVHANTGQIINNAAQVGGHPNLAPVARAAPVPDRPHDPVYELPARSRLEAWLCLKHLEVGGPLTPECPTGANDLRAALKSTRASSTR